MDAKGESAPFGRKEEDEGREKAVSNATTKDKSKPLNGSKGCRHQEKMR